MESSPNFGFYFAGLINLRVTASHTMPHRGLCGYLRLTRTSGWVVTNIRGSDGAGVIRVWKFNIADGRIDYQSGQMEVLFNTPRRWPYGLRLGPVPRQSDI